MIYINVDGWKFVITVQNSDNKNFGMFKKKKKPQKFWDKNQQFLCEVVGFFFLKSNFVNIYIL